MMPKVILSPMATIKRIELRLKLLKIWGKTSSQFISGFLPWVYLPLEGEGWRNSLLFNDLSRGQNLLFGNQSRERIGSHRFSGTPNNVKLAILLYPANLNNLWTWLLVGSTVTNPSGAMNCNPRTASRTFLGSGVPAFSTALAQRYTPK